MANIRYSVACPSCEADVPIRSSALVGKKTECPKCKYRFTVPEPPDGAGDDADAKPAKKDKGKKKPAKKANTGVLVGVVLGVLAVGGLGTAAYFVLGGDDSPKPSPTPPVAARPADGGGAAKPSDDKPADDKPMADGKPADGDAKPADGDAKPADGAAKPADKPKTSGDQKDVTNLLPNDTRAVYRVNFDRLKQSATPVYSSVFDNYVQGLFQTSLTIPFDDMETYIHCIVGPDREPFGVVRTKSPIDRSRLYQALELDKPAGATTAKREYFLIKQNPFVDAVAKAFTLKAVIGLMGLSSSIRLPDPPPPDPKLPPKKYAVCVFDDTTLFIGAEGSVERFLTVDLQDNGYPTFKSELSPEDPPPADPNAPPAPEGGGPEGGRPGGGSGQRPGGGPRPDDISLRQQGRRPGGGPPPSGGGEGPPGAPNAPPGRARKLYTSVPTYRTIDPELKRLLNQLEEDAKNPPAVIYAEVIDQQLIAARQAGEMFRETANPLAGLASRMRLIGGVLSQFDREKGNGRLAFEFVSDDEARRAVNENIRPLLNLLKLIADPTLSMQTTIGGGPSDPGPGAGPGGGDEGGLAGPPGGRGGPPGGSSGGLPGGRGGRGGPPGEDGGGGAAPGGPTGTFLDDGKGTITLGQTDKVVTVSADMDWPEDKFTSVLMPRVVRTGGQVRGRIAVQSGEADWHSLAAAAVKLGKEKKPFPRGTVNRETKEERYRMPYPPEQRVSFLADLLPYLGRAGLRSQIQDKKVWWGKENLPTAETWVPEFLVPYYPQDAWRVESHPKADGRPLGGTNYVAPAGLGLDSARFEPADPKLAKLVGITGYDWGSKPEEVTDGLANTIYLLQVKPEDRQPWISGGGATVRGVDDKAADPLDDFAHKAPDGRRGTYALMADGSVRWLPKGIKPEVFKGMVTRAGGESLGDLDAVAPADKSKRKDTELKGGGGLPAPKSGDAKPMAGKVDADELKKFQGKWKPTAAVVAGKKLDGEALTKLNMAASFEGTIFKTTSALTGAESDEVVKLDATAKPARITLKSLNKAGKTEYGVYEFDGADKLKVFLTDSETGLPAAVAPPKDGEKAGYFELERVK